MTLDLTQERRRNATLYYLFVSFGAIAGLFILNAFTPSAPVFTHFTLFGISFNVVSMLGGALIGAAVSDLMWFLAYPRPSDETAH